jgi:hypothetical protein
MHTQMMEMRLELREVQGVTCRVAVVRQGLEGL